MAGAIDLDGKVAIITGAAGGIGSATARLMAARGARLILADLALERAEALALELGDRAAAQLLDLGDESSVKTCIAAAQAKFGRLDILHNNAAALSPRLGRRDMGIADMATEVWDETFHVNVRGTMIACREALPLLAQSQGAIVNMVSNLALQGHIVQTAYSASKAAVIQMTRSIAASHGPLGVRCNCVAPGLTLTPAVEQVFPARVRELVAEETLRERLGNPEELAEVVAFIASPAARNINGQLIVADGGLSTHVPGIARYRELGREGGPQ